MKITGIELVADNERGALAGLSTAKALLSIALLSIGFALAGCFSDPAPTAIDDEASLVGIIQAIEQGWEQANGTPFREHFLDFEGARYIEGGGQNQGLSDLIEHHVVPEGDALENFDLTFSNIETHFEGEFAWAIADVEVVATITGDGRRIHNRGHETFLFRLDSGKWKVVHTHSSSRPVKTEAEGHQQ